ncbi:NADP-dependent oxidoreductase domain-containing protein [Phlyctochytrium arcticum]|nr:NADP-dependent oxidoreductase domain-containing protein [Phlyctochytrium arcticum]
MATTTVKLSSGYDMPLLGLGTWKSEEGEVGAAIKAAIEAGYKHIDGAWAYQNEKECGQALKSLFESNKISRKDLFYTSKLWNRFHHPSHVQECLDDTLKNLQLEYLDLWLMHWPVAFKYDSKGLQETDADGKVLTEDVDIVDTWRAMEKMVETGKVRSIGVSNFTIKNLEKILAIAKIKPAVNQVELHPYLPQTALLDFCAKHNIHVTAYSPLGSGNKEPNLLEDPIIKEIADKHKKNVGQVCISWGVKRGTTVIPKSVKAERIRSNFEIIDLTEEEMKKINSIKTRKRVVDPKEFWKVDVFGGDFADK